LGRSLFSCWLSLFFFAISFLPSWLSKTTEHNGPTRDFIWGENQILSLAAKRPFKAAGNPAFTAICMMTSMSHAYNPSLPLRSGSGSSARSVRENDMVTELGVCAAHGVRWFHRWPPSTVSDLYRLKSSITSFASWSPTPCFLRACRV
jgi:hypothetical protein